MSDSLQTAVTTCILIAVAAMLVLLCNGCASPHFLAGDALVCTEGGEYHESEAGIAVTCRGEMRWTGPISRQGAAVALGAIRGALGAPGVP